MLIGKKCIMSLFVMMTVMCSFVSHSYSQEKPSEDVMKGIIVTLELHTDVIQNITNINYIEFNITNSFTSNKNNRYCIEVNYILNYLWGTGYENKTENNVRYSFEKKGNQWYGWKGWGWGEE